MVKHAPKSAPRHRFAQFWPKHGLKRLKTPIFSWQSRGVNPPGNPGVQASPQRSFKSRLKGFQKGFKAALKARLRKRPMDAGPCWAVARQGNRDRFAGSGIAPSSPLAAWALSRPSEPCPESRVGAGARPGIAKQMAFLVLSGERPIYDDNRNARFMREGVGRNVCNGFG